MSKKILLFIAAFLYITLVFTINCAAQFQENINEVFTWQEDSIVGSNWFDNAYNEIWGVHINDKDFAIIGHTEGTSIFDVTDKTNITFVDFFTSPLTGGDVIHRDYHDYMGYLYVVCDEGNGISTLQIVDLNDLPNSINEVYNSNDLFTRSHNIFIDTATAKLYVCSHSSLNNGFQPMAIYSLAEPTNPTFLNYYTEPGHVHDIYVRNDTAYCNNGPDGFAIVKFDDAGNYVTLGTLTSYPEQGYNHSGWLTKDGNYYVMADETWGTRMKLLDVSDPSDIQVMSLFGSETTASSIVHNLIIEENYVFVSHYYDGLQVFDIADPLNPVRVGQYDTFLGNNNVSYEGAWGVYPDIKTNTILISDMQTGLYVFEMELAPQADFSITENSWGDYSLENTSLWEPYLFGWIIDDVNVASGENLDYIFDEPGTYNVCLVVFNDFGQDTSCQTIFISPGLNLEDAYLDNEIFIQAKDGFIHFNYSLETEKNVTYEIFDVNGSLLFSDAFLESWEVERKIKSTLKNRLIIASISIGDERYNKKVWLE